MRLVDELGWLHAMMGAVPRHRHAIAPGSPVIAVKLAAADVLERAGELLDGAAEKSLSLASLETAAARMEQEGSGGELSALDPAFRARELASAVVAIAGNVSCSWQPSVVPGTSA